MKPVRPSILLSSIPPSVRPSSFRLYVRPPCFRPSILHSCIRLSACPLLFYSVCPSYTIRAPFLSSVLPSWRPSVHPLVLRPCPRPSVGPTSLPPSMSSTAVSFFALSPFPSSSPAPSSLCRQRLIINRWRVLVAVDDREQALP